MEKTLLIYNPTSGSRAFAKKLDMVVKSFLGKDVLPIPVRLDAGLGEDALEELIKSEDYSFLTISGGDGTISSVVNIMMRYNRVAPIGIIPAGTCNDFARSLNIPMDIKKCIDIILARNVAEIDAGIINGEVYFLNTCAGGNFVDASYSTNNDLKKNFGPLAYYMKALGEVASIKPMHLKVTTDSETIENEFLLFLILNGKHAAGFSNLVKSADLSDGCMDLILVKNCQPYEMAALFLKVLSMDFLNDKNVMFFRTKKCKIEGHFDLPLTVDGESMMNLPITVTFLQRVLKVYI